MLFSQEYNLTESNLGGGLNGTRWLANSCPWNTTGKLLFFMTETRLGPQYCVGVCNISETIFNDTCHSHTFSSFNSIEL